MSKVIASAAKISHVLSTTSSFPCPQTAQRPVRRSELDYLLHLIPTNTCAGAVRHGGIGLTVERNEVVDMAGLIRLLIVCAFGTRRVESEGSGERRESTECVY